MKQKIILFLLVGILFPFFKVQAQLMRWDKFIHIQVGTKDFFKPKRKLTYIYQHQTPFVEAGFALMSWERISMGASLGYDAQLVWRYNKKPELWHKTQKIAYLSLFSRIYLSNGYRNNFYFLAKGMFGPLMYKIYDQENLTESGTKFWLTYNLMVGFDMFFTEHLGLYAEAGWGASFVNAGLIYKL